MSFVKMLAAGLFMTAAGAAQAATTATGYTLGNNGKKLVIIGDLADPGMLKGRTVRNEMGKVLSLSELTIRPRTGQLYGYSDDDNTVYLVNPRTGRAQALATLDDATGVDAVGFDFNNQIDRARIVAITDENLVFNPADNTIVATTPLFYAAGDVNAGRDPSVFANAYTNAIPFPTTTTQYVIDSKFDSLATLANNAGTLTTVGSFFLNGKGFDIGLDGGFDILSFFEGDNTAYAILDTTGGQSLYTFSLTPDAMRRINLTSAGMVGADFGVVNGLTVAPAVVPLPAGGLLLGGALLGLGLLRRRGKAA